MSFCKGSKLQNRSIDFAFSLVYSNMAEDIERHVVRKFEICQRLGKGVGNFNCISRNNHLQAYGIVWKAIEKRSRAVIALKKCFDAFRNATDAQRTFREIMYLQVFCGWNHFKVNF